MPILCPQPNTKETIYTVSTLNKASRILLEGQFNRIKVEGEISNLVCSSAGHYYFKLKDDNAQVQCAFFKGRAMKLDFTLKNGQQILVSANVSLYEARGDYQLIVEKITPAGLGALQLRFEVLRKKLEQEGLFSDKNKQELPYLPSSIGLITSPKAAAFFDILTTLKRRFKAVPIVLYPTDVQGVAAAGKIARAIDIANRRRDCEVLIVARGGGSIEDLWAFNEEIVARAIFKSELPIVTGIGHEIDFTIADFCADLRAATPTAAAEAVTPNAWELLDTLVASNEHLIYLVNLQLKTVTLKLRHLQQRLKAPNYLLSHNIQHADKLYQALCTSLNYQINHSRNKLHQLEARLQKQHLNQRLFQQQQTLTQLYQRLQDCLSNKLQQKKITFTKLCATLHATSPLATIERGYSLAMTNKGKLITEAKQLQIGELFSVRLKNEKLLCELKGIDHV